MFPRLTKFQLFFHPDPAGGGGDKDTAPKGSDIQDDINFLGMEDDTNKDDDNVDLLKDDKTPKDKDDKKEKKEEKPEKKEEKDEKDLDDDDDDEKDEEDEDELESLVEELEEPDEEKLELTTPVRRREILKKYPNLFKDFPYLEKAYYREQQFTEILPTIDDAKQAVEKAETLDKFEQDLMSGNTETILKTVREQDPNSFYKIVDDYLPALARVDEKAYQHVLSNVSKHTIIAMVQEGRRSGNDVLLSAAQVMNQFVFGTTEFEQPGKLSKDAPKSDDAQTKLEKDKQEFTRQKFESARGDLNSRINNSLKSTIESNIDPRGSMTSYVKNNAIRDANEQLNTLLTGDKRFAIIIDKLWKNAFEKDFNKDSIDRIRSAYLSKAKTLLPSVIKKARIEALKGMGKRVKDSDTNDDKNRPNKTEKSRSDKSDKSDKTAVPRGKSTLDFLMED